jgi:hypothetical protein
VKSNSKSARNVSTMHRNNPAANEVSIAPITLLNEGVDAIIDAQKSTLDATARYSFHAIELWKKVFYFAFGTPSDEGPQPGERGRVLPFKAESRTEGGSKPRRRRGRSRAA